MQTTEQTILKNQLEKTKLNEKNSNFTSTHIILFIHQFNNNIIHSVIFFFSVYFNTYLNEHTNVA
jgi:esterase/lipase superfamily enzyme